MVPSSNIVLNFHVDWLRNLRTSGHTRYTQEREKEIGRRISSSFGARAVGPT